MKYTKCNKCNNKFRNNNIKRHQLTCGNKKVKVYEKIGELYKCPICMQLYKKYGINCHIWRTHTKPGISFIKGRIPWNKGLSAKSDIRVRNNGIAVSKTVRAKVLNGTYIPRIMGPAGRKKVSVMQSLHNNGGKCKWYEVNEIKVQGTWERDLALKMVELGIKWYKPKTNLDIFRYKLNEKDKSYAPDFYLPDYNLYLEVKGYWWGNDKDKMKAVLEQHDNLKQNIKLIRKELFKKLLQCKTKKQFICDLDRDGDIVLV